MRYVAVFSVWTKFINKWHINLYHHNPFVFVVNQWEIIAKEFISHVDSGQKNVAHIQNNLLYICLFTDFARLKTI